MSGSYQYLFERLGGAARVREVADDFNKRFVQDETLLSQFQDVKMCLLRIHQFLFLKVAFSGEGTIAQQDVKRLIHQHRRLFLETGLCEEHFDRIVEHMAESLRHSQVPEELVIQARASLAPLRSIFQHGRDSCEQDPLCTMKDDSNHSSPLMLDDELQRLVVENINHEQKPLPAGDKLNENEEGKYGDQASKSKDQENASIRPSRRPSLLQRLNSSRALRRFSTHAA